MVGLLQQSTLAGVGRRHGLAVAGGGAGSAENILDQFRVENILGIMFTLLVLFGLEYT